MGPTKQAHASRRYDPHFRTLEGPYAVVRACNHCSHTETVKKGVRGVGRGYGMREGNKARGRIIQHIKEFHADKLDATPAP